MILEISSHLLMLWLYEATLLAAKRWPLAQTHLCSSSNSNQSDIHHLCPAQFLPTSLSLRRATGVKTVIPVREAKKDKLEITDTGTSLQIFLSCVVTISGPKGMQRTGTFILCDQMTEVSQDNEQLLSYSRAAA